MTQHKLPRDLVALPVVAVRATDTRGNDLDQDFIITGRDNGPLLYLELPGTCPDDSAV